VRSDYRDISGILLLDKPVGLSSNQALQRVRHLLRARKAGHTGSLDPLASGLLPVCFGEATKIAGHLLGSRKAYAAQFRLGATTSTDDADGETLTERPVPDFAPDAIDAALCTLRGRIEQTPPVYSAIKQRGVALYKRARRGEDVHVPQRIVDIHRLDLTWRTGDTLGVYVECGSGTYVRSLARDLGERLGCGAHLVALRRLWVDPFREPVMWQVEQLAARVETDGTPALDTLLLPLETALQSLPVLVLDDEQAQRLSQGKRLAQAHLVALPVGRAIDAAGRLVALVAIDEVGEVRVLRGFNRAAG